ncbi:MAG: ribonuclease P protein component [Candidatus Hydrogenedentes bacterium]|nr:ribonuclease P protein component [Candidatus Hydrogenedentota bacterium]
MPGPQAFPRHERLTRKRDFETAFKSGRRSVGSAFICYVARRESQGRKFGFAVSRKVGTAVIRNRVKRYLREFFRTHRAQIDDDTHIVVVARPAAANAGYDQCVREMRRLLGEVEVMHG